MVKLVYQGKNDSYINKFINVSKEIRKRVNCLEKGRRSEPAGRLVWGLGGTHTLIEMNEDTLRKKKQVDMFKKYL